MALSPSRLIKPVFVIVTITLVAFAAGVVYMTILENKVKRTTSIDSKDVATIQSFSDCVSAGNPVMESYPEQCVAEGKSYTRQLPSKASIDKETLPDGWSLVEQDDDNQVIAKLNSGMGSDISLPSCNLQALVSNVEDPERTTDETLREAALLSAKDNKGYVVNGMVAEEFVLNLNGMKQSVTFQRYDSTLESDDYLLHTVDTYVVGKNQFALVAITCSNGEFGSVQAVLDALIIEVY